jgi:GABA permease
MTHNAPGLLVIANRTCPCPALLDEVARRAGNPPIDVLVVAPALNSRLRHWLSDVDDAVARAHDRLELALAELRARGVGARGEVGDANPLVAIADALARFPASAIVIATLPPGQSNWLERGLIDKVRARFQVPVTHLVSAEGRIEQGLAAGPNLRPADFPTPRTVRPPAAPAVDRPANVA